MTDVEARPFVRPPGSGHTTEHPLGERLIDWASGEETGRALTFFESVVSRGEGPPLHVHVRQDEFVYVIAGRLRVRLEEAVHDAPAGSFVFIPMNVPHTWLSAGDRPTRFLFGFAPAAPGMERFFEHGSKFTAATWVAEAFNRFADDAGMEVVGPPLAQSHPPLGSQTPETDQHRPVALQSHEILALGKKQ